MVKSNLLEPSNYIISLLFGWIVNLQRYQETKNLIWLLLSPSGLAIIALNLYQPNQILVDLHLLFDTSEPFLSRILSTIFYSSIVYSITIGVLDVVRFSNLRILDSKQLPVYNKTPLSENTNNKYSKSLMFALFCGFAGLHDYANQKYSRGVVKSIAFILCIILNFVPSQIEDLSLAINILILILFVLVLTNYYWDIFRIINKNYKNKAGQIITNIEGDQIE